MALPLSIRTSLRGPYDDAFGADGLLRYAYRGTDPEHRENRGLRELMRRRVPLVYLHAVVKGEYLVSWPVFVVEDHPRLLKFTVAVDDARLMEQQPDAVVGSYDLESEQGDERRRYITRELKVRLHQRTFRKRVLRAYRERCSLCRLRHQALLDAAHIIADADPGGEPRVQNGLALCKLHHAAFDRHFLAVRPDYVVEVRPDILDEEDGPMLIHGLKGLHRASISLPRSASHRPDRRLLEARFERFRTAKR